MHDDTEFKTEVDCSSFHLPSAFKLHNRKHEHLIAIASLVASISVVTIIGAQIVGLI